MNILNTIASVHLKMVKLAQSREHVILDLRAVSSSPTLGVEII